MVNIITAMIIKKPKTKKNKQFSLCITIKILDKNSIKKFRESKRKVIREKLIVIE